MTERAGAPRTAVLGLGNVLMGDDALGPWVIQHLLTQWEVPPSVRVQDLGTPGLDLHPLPIHSATCLWHSDRLG